MVFTVGAVVVAVAVLLVTLSGSSVRGNTPNMNPFMLLKPTADTTKITVLAEDNYGTRGFNITLQKQECFRSDSEWYFTQVNVTKEADGIFRLNMAVGACEIECIKKDFGMRTDRMPSITGELKDVTVILFGLEDSIKTPGKTKNIDDYIYREIINCNNVTILKDDQRPFCPCASASPNTAPPLAPLTKKPLGGRLSQLGTILGGALVVQLIGTAVMTVVVIKVVCCGFRHDRQPHQS